MATAKQIMVRAKNILVTFFFIFLSVSLFAVHENDEQTPSDKGTEQTEKINESEKSAPVKTNPDNDQWQNDNKKHRIPAEFEITQPLITYKRQQVA